ncbi:hypothetical protein BDP55DRAFT_86440 [Colletotrichum godetiae]|uniref:Uncharacterized protein n=1 Tax=Colletotrichum godetiae TaxID=1209918 RepID=A0AAJ0AP45_9PEZI|nr:uncharacterized protein BDP55DRAFT_86440 [Colletotrichum godetiae]KAK1687786.1 hypothetical protein BDP55DRAFT_86440 [Colletotrichum godetiae]
MPQALGRRLIAWHPLGGAAVGVAALAGCSFLSRNIPRSPVSVRDFDHGPASLPVGVKLCHGPFCEPCSPLAQLLPFLPLISRPGIPSLPFLDPFQVTVT